MKVFLSPCAICIFSRPYDIIRGSLWNERLWSGLNCVFRMACRHLNRELVSNRLAPARQIGRKAIQIEGQIRWGPSESVICDINIHLYIQCIAGMCAAKLLQNWCYLMKAKSPLLPVGMVVSVLRRTCVQPNKCSWYHWPNKTTGHIRSKTVI